MHWHTEFHTFSNKKTLLFFPLSLHITVSQRVCTQISLWSTQALRIPPMEFFCFPIFVLSLVSTRYQNCTQTCTKVHCMFLCAHVLYKHCTCVKLHCVHEYMFTNVQILYSVHVHVHVKHAQYMMYMYNMHVWWHWLPHPPIKRNKCVFMCTNVQLLQQSSLLKWIKSVAYTSCTMYTVPSP